MVASIELVSLIWLLNTGNNCIMVINQVHLKKLIVNYFHIIKKN